MPRHHHQWQITGIGTVPPASKLTKKNWPQLYFHCYTCHATKQRKMTDKEIIKYRKQQKEIFAHASRLHKLWNDFLKKFQDDNHQWKYHGFDFIERVKRYAKTHPQIAITGCDDNYSCSSSIVFVPHEADGEWVGVTMLIVSQYNNPPIDVFLQPSHAQDLLNTLFKIHQGKKFFKIPKQFHNCTKITQQIGLLPP